MLVICLPRTEQALWIGIVTGPGDSYEPQAGPSRAEHLWNKRKNLAGEAWAVYGREIMSVKEVRFHLESNRPWEAGGCETCRGRMWMSWRCSRQKCGWCQGTEVYVGSPFILEVPPARLGWSV